MQNVNGKPFQFLPLSSFSLSSLNSKKSTRLAGKFSVYFIYSKINPCMILDCNEILAYFVCSI